MFTTNPWAVYVYIAGPVIAGYYLFAIARFYGKEIKARIGASARLKGNNGSAHLAMGNGDHQTPQERGLNLTPSDPQPAGKIQAESLQESQHRSVIGHDELKAHLTDLIDESHQKDCEKTELIHLLQMTIKDYLDFQAAQFQSMISELIEDECAKYGSIHLGEKDKAAIWGKV